MAAAQPTTYRPAGELALATALAPYTGPWNRRLAAHLLRRAGFGGTPDDVARAASMGPHDAVDAVVHFADVSRLPDAPPALEDIVPPGGPLMPALRRQAAIAMQQWWLGRMIVTPAPLQEKMTLFLHGHFASALQKGITPQELVVQNQLFRRNALGNFHALTLAVSRDPAMLKYLDNTRSQKAQPNENYARELMELFTLGIGNYTEADVRESARAFTGWQTRRGTGFYVNERQHDDGTKAFLGRSGNFDGKDIVDIIFAQPAAARFLAAKLLDYFVYSDPEPQLVDAVAAVVRKNDFELRPVMSTILRSNVFFSERSYRALVKSPVEFVVGAYQTFGITEVDQTALAALRRMGQVLFYPPSVKGWDGGAAWLNSQSVLSRENFASALMQNPMMMRAAWLAQNSSLEPRALAQRLVDTILLGDVSPASTARLVGFLNGNDVSAMGMLSGENVDERIRGAAYLTMAMPAYQLN